MAASSPPSAGSAARRARSGFSQPPIPNARTAEAVDRAVGAAAQIVQVTQVRHSGQNDEEKDHRTPQRPPRRGAEHRGPQSGRPRGRSAAAMRARGIACSQVSTRSTRGWAAATRRPAWPSTCGTGPSRQGHVGPGTRRAGKPTEARAAAGRWRATDRPSPEPAAVPMSGSTVEAAAAVGAAARAATR